MANELDLNTMYSILKGIFNREQNENYTNRNHSNFAGGLADLRNGWAAMQNDRKNRRDQAQYNNGMGDGGNPSYANGAIGATADGVYGVNSMPPQPNGGIGVDANGVYGVNGTPQPNQSVFGGGNNGFDWSKVTPMSNGGSVMDAWGKQGSMFGGMTSMNFPQTPQGSGGFNSVFSGANANPSMPSISSSNLAQGVGGQNVSANDISRYLGNEYNRATWIQNDMANNGVTNPLISMLRYDTKIAPLISAAREDELRNAFRIIQTANPNSKEYNDAVSIIQYHKNDPYMAENQDWSREERDMRRKRFGWDEEMFEARKANGFLPLRGGGRVGRPSGSGSSIGRTPKIKGIDQSLLDEDMIDSLKSFKADSTSAENFDNMIGNMRALKARLMQERGLSDEDAGAFVGSVLKKSLGTTYYKLPQKQKTFLMNSFNGIDSYGEKPTAPERKLAGQGYLDSIKKAEGEKFDRLIKNGNMESYEDNQPSGAVIDGVYYSDQTLENLAKEKARLEQAVKDGTFGYYGENGFGAMPKGESIRRAQELQDEDVLDGIEETDRWKEALRSLI